MTENILNLIRLELLTGTAQIPEHAKWVGVDYDGGVYWYIKHPILTRESDDELYWSFTNRHINIHPSSYYDLMFELPEGSYPPYSEVMLCSVEDIFNF